MSAQETLGKLISESEKRDAIHIALAPVVASQRLLAGQDIGFVAGNTEMVGRTGKHIGIVDPFLKEPVSEGERFWMFLYPNTIASLRHEWEHPSFGAVVSKPVPANGERKATSVGWLTRFADGLDLTYATLMDGAKEWVRDGEYLFGGSNLEGEQIPDEFWTHYEIVTGEIVDHDKKCNFFSCYC